MNPSSLLQRDQLQDGVGGVTADRSILYPGSPAEQRLILHALVVEDDPGRLFTLQDELHFEVDGAPAEEVGQVAQRRVRRADRQELEVVLQGQRAEHQARSALLV